MWRSCVCCPLSRSFQITQRQKNFSASSPPQSPVKVHPPLKSHPSSQAQLNSGDCWRKNNEVWSPLFEKSHLQTRSKIQASSLHNYFQRQLKLRRFWVAGIFNSSQLIRWCDFCEEDLIFEVWINLKEKWRRLVFKKVTTRLGKALLSESTNRSPLSQRVSLTNLNTIPS